MKLTRVSFENVMELEGAIDFPEGKTVVIYGENKAGKSNIIHALRYAFLNKVVGSRRASGYDELRLVTSKEVAPADGVGKMDIEFSHDGREFEIIREIDRYKDNNRILRKEDGGFQELDFKKTVNKELKAGLLDALFAPDSAMGFKHLNEKNIDAVIRELFKEVGNAKVLTENFKQRVQRLREEAAARAANIEMNYGAFVAGLKESLGDVALDLSVFDTYEPGRTSGKISGIADRLKEHADSLERGELKGQIEEMRKRAGDAEGIEALLGKDEELRGCFKRIAEISRDREHLSELVAELKEAKLGGPALSEAGDFYNAELDGRVKNILQKLRESQSRYSRALALAREEKIDFKVDNPARIRSDKEKVLRLLTRDVLTGDARRVRVDLVKIASEQGEESVHGLIPLELMDEDPAFTRLSPEPIPDAPEEQKKEYARALVKRIESLKNICEDKDRAESFFGNEFVSELTRISGYGTTLMEEDVPRYRNVWSELAKQRRGEWENGDAEYVELGYVPAVVDGIDKALDTVLDNAFDEQEVMQGIQDVIIEINGKLAAEGLINSCIEMGEGSLQLSRTTYKDREITHPCGAERSFFSLATLTALARYFRLPVIIDEAANNLDKNHLRHFISLVREFAASYDVQYILSIKETDNFPLDGWVREFAGDLQIYNVDYDGDKKWIKPVDLYA